MYYLHDNISTESSSGKETRYGYEWVLILSSHLQTFIEIDLYIVDGVLSSSCGNHWGPSSHISRNPACSTTALEMPVDTFPFPFPSLY
jgi:hypothetical protein